MLLLASLLVLGSVSAAVPEVSYQIHSYNDLREWRQVLIKGATWFKIDPYYMPPIFCKSQNRVSNSTNGCLVLNHNTPSGSNNNYNTTTDVLALIASPEYAQWFQTGNKMHIALCLKYSDNPCDNSTNSNRLLSLLDEFFLSAQTLIAGFINVEFILDGSATPNNHTCLNTRWSPWVATWIINSDPLDALESNSLTDGHNRYQVNNMPENIFNSLWNIEFLEQLSFGKFLHGQYPFLFWEPSDQATIQSVSQYYINGKHHQENGLRFAINIDPIMFDVYSGSITGNAINKPLGIAGSNPFVSGTNMAVFDGTCVRSTQLDVLSGNITTPFCLPVPNATISSYSATSFMGYNWMLVGYPDGHYVILNGTEVFAEGNAGNVAYFNVIALTNLGSTLGLVVASLYQQTVDVEAYIFELEDHTLELLGDGLLFGDVQATTLSLGFFGEELLMTFSSQEDKTFATMMTLNIANGLLLKVAPWEFGIGSQPSVSVWQYNITSPPYVLILRGDGFCWNSNNNNKQSNPLLCDQTPQSTSNVLVYTFGLLSDWLSVGNSFGMITPCHNSIITGMYDMGNNPSASLVFQDGTLYAVSVHQGIPGGTSDPEGCGLANSYDGIVFDAFKLPLL